jgi:hypothetical protein
VGRTSVEAVGEAVEAVSEDPATVGEAVVSVDLAVLGKVVVDEASVVDLAGGR